MLCPLDSLLTAAFYGWVSVAPLLLQPCRLKWSLSLSNNQLSSFLSLSQPMFLSLCLSIAPSLQSFSYSCFGFPWYLVRQGCNEWHFSPVALGDWDWQPSCLLVSSAGWFKNATRYTHINSWSVSTETPHISYVFVSVSTTVTIALQLLLALFACFIFTQLKHILYIDWERKWMPNVNMDSFLFPPKSFQKRIICPLTSPATF